MANPDENVNKSAKRHKVLSKMSFLDPFLAFLIDFPPNNGYLRLVSEDLPSVLAMVM